VTILFVREHGGGIHLGRYKLRWEDNIKMAFKDMGYEGVG
jgi:hypothetical protein